jgi:hypothetical protein
MIVPLATNQIVNAVGLVMFIAFSIALIVSFGSVGAGYAMTLSWDLLSALILTMVRKEGLISQKHHLAIDK